MSLLSYSECLIYFWGKQKIYLEVETQKIYSYYRDHMHLGGGAQSIL